MGFGAVSSLLLSQDGETGFEMAPVIGLNETQSANNYVTDSPAGGTALATGTRTCNGFLGVGPDSVQLESILKKAQAMGKKTGIVVNTTLTEATPGAFYAGVTSRSMSYKIAEQFCESGVDVAVGSGLSAFINRPDSVDLTATLINKGYDVYLDWKSVLNTQSEKFVGILEMGDVHRRTKSSNKTAGAADGAEVCLAAKLAADAGNLDTTRFSEPTVYLEKASVKALEDAGYQNAEAVATAIDAKIAALDLANAYDAKGAAAAAETAAKAHADGIDAALKARLVVLEAIDHSKFEAAGAAAQALIDAKAYTDAEIAGHVTALSTAEIDAAIASAKAQA